jgi:hypothetical protein
MWLALLAIRITVITLSYSSLSTNLLVGMLIAFGGTVFLVSVSTQKFMVFQQYNHLRTGLPQQVGSQESR